MKKLVLTEEDFQKLTNGEVVEQDGVQIILQDIGWPRMLTIIKSNMHNIDFETMQRILQKVLNRT